MGGFLRLVAIATIAPAAWAAGPKVYIVNEYTAITDTNAYKAYAAQVPPTLEGYGGKYVVRGGNISILRGDSAPTSVVMLEFPDRAAFEAWASSDGYKRLAPLRLAATEGRTFLIEAPPGQ